MDRVRKANSSRHGFGPTWNARTWEKENSWERGMVGGGAYGHGAAGTYRHGGWLGHVGMGHERRPRHTKSMH
jgi:hypothetical protein